MKIYIPSYRRADTQLTFNALPEDWKRRTIFVLDEQDAKYMTPGLIAKGAEVLVVSSVIQTIAAKRAWILQHTTERKIVMMDDDLRFAIRDKANEGKLLKATPEEVGVALYELDTKLNEFVHAGFSARQGNNRLPGGWKSPGRMMYVLGYQPAVMREHCELGRIETREDFDYTLQLLRQGFENAVNCDFCVDQTYNNKGGCYTQRTVESNNIDANKLAAFHPKYVKVVQKKYVVSVPRKEVIVQWKRALEDARV